MEMKEHIDNTVIPDILRTIEDIKCASNAYIDFKDYKDYIDYIYTELEKHGVSRNKMLLQAYSLGLKIDYVR